MVGRRWSMAEERKAEPPGVAVSWGTAVEAALKEKREQLEDFAEALMDLCRFEDEGGAVGDDA